MSLGLTFPILVQNSRKHHGESASLPFLSNAYVHCLCAPKTLSGEGENDWRNL
jgi:hypothetical protein